MALVVKLGDTRTSTSKIWYKVTLKIILEWICRQLFFFQADTAPRGLSMNVIWGDVPLITDGAGVNIIRQDDTLSMHWRFVEP